MLPVFKYYYTTTKIDPFMLNTELYIKCSNTKIIHNGVLFTNIGDLQEYILKACTAAQPINMAGIIIYAVMYDINSYKISYDFIRVISNEKAKLHKKFNIRRLRFENLLTNSETSPIFDIPVENRIFQYSAYDQYSNIDECITHTLLKHKPYNTSRCLIQVLDREPFVTKFSINE